MYSFRLIEVNGVESLQPKFLYSQSCKMYNDADGRHWKSKEHSKDINSFWSNLTWHMYLHLGKSLNVECVLNVPEIWYTILCKHYTSWTICTGEHHSNADHCNIYFDTRLYSNGSHFKFLMVISIFMHHYTAESFAVLYIFMDSENSVTMVISSIQ